MSNGNIMFIHISCENNLHEITLSLEFACEKPPSMLSIQIMSDCKHFFNQLICGLNFNIKSF